MLDLTQLRFAPRVTVVIPLYQSEATIADTLASVQAQTFTDFEVLVVDDGSRDAGADIVRGMAQRSSDRRIRIVSQANRGLAGARNTGIREAAGEFLAFLDADDLWHPEKLAAHVAQLDAHPALGVSFSSSRLIDEAGKSLGLKQTPQTRTLEAADIFCRNPIGNGSTPVIRRTALEQISLHDAARGYVCWFDEDFRRSEDIECWTRLAVAGVKFGHVARTLTDYRITAGGLSADTDAQYATWATFRDKVKCYAPKLVGEHGRRAEGYQLRYLARRAVRSGRPGLALSLARRALTLYPRQVMEEPIRTLVTLAAACLTAHPRIARAVQ